MDVKTLSPSKIQERIVGFWEYDAEEHKTDEVRGGPRKLQA
jgi:hypothetical protein